MSVRFTREAAIELEYVLTGIAAESSQGAHRVRSRIQNVVRLLTEYPGSGQRTTCGSLRRIVVSPYPYVIFYRVDDGDVIIIGIRHAARNPSAMPDQSG